MFVGEKDRVARSVALEKTYVHDVYDQMSALQYLEQRNSPTWPKVKKFISDLEPGSSVCDAGCGSGKYLEINSGVYKVGIDICKKLTQIAKDEDKEVILCDNLTLPFRDEAFDAVISIAVIHHFATRERRVCALRELARILRVGGRLLITVWAMEQKHRKFETQDVLVPWHRPQYHQSSSLEVSTTTTETSEEDISTSSFRIPLKPSELESLYARSCSLKEGEGNRDKSFRSLKWIKRSAASSSSTLSSPNETCYSFVRKALQKLSRGSKREKHQSRTWFLESWTSLSRDDHLPATRYEPEGCEEDSDIQDLPIEIIRMDTEQETSQVEKAIPVTDELLQVHLPPQKSRSMNDIVKLESALVIKSRSSVTSLDARKPQVKPSLEKLNIDNLKPRLVKQKKSLCEEQDEEEIFEATDEVQKLEKFMTPAEISPGKLEKFNVLKQKSLTEEIMSRDRLREKERVRQNIHKQASLNEELIYRRQRTSLNSIKDTLFSGSTAKRFQLFRSGLTNKIKSSTTSIEKVTGSSIKSGFVRIFQNLTGSDSRNSTSQESTSNSGIRKSSSEDKGDEFPGERRCSHEENSDSSKDNSLQSDTSVDSEDSVISVIERVVSKTEQICSPTKISSAGPNSPKIMQHNLSGILSHPSSPKIVQSIQGKALSLPASPRTIIVSPNIKQTFKIPPPIAQILPNEKIITTKASANGNAFLYDKSAAITSASTSKPQTEEEMPLIKLSSMKKLKVFSDNDMKMLSQKLLFLSEKESFLQSEPRGDVCEGDDSEKSDTELDPTPKTSSKRDSPDTSSYYKTGNIPRSVYAVVRKSSIGPGASLAHAARLPSYEIFNPETEDIDTDSSGVSTPDSVGSVISVKIDEFETPLTAPSEDKAVSEEYKEISDKTTEPCHRALITPPTLETGYDFDKLPIGKTSQDLYIPEKEKSIPTLGETTHESEDNKVLRETSQVPTFLGEICEQRTQIDIKISKKIEILKQAQESLKNRAVQNESSEEKIHKPPIMPYPSLSKSPTDELWGNECRQYLVEFAENLSEKLLAEIDRYKEENICTEEDDSPVEDIPDPYLTKLSEELHHISKLTKELSQDYSSKYAVSSKQVELGSEEIEEQNIAETGKEEKVSESLLVSESSTDAESPGSVTGWLDSRRNTIESTGAKERELPIAIQLPESALKRKASEDLKKPEMLELESLRRLSTSMLPPDPVRKLSKGNVHSGLQARSSVESTDTIDMSERTVSSRTGTSSRMSLESDVGDTLDKSSDTSKSRQEPSDRKHSSSQVSLRPGESIESSDTYDISDRTGSISDFSRQNTESRSIITQSSASLASWSECSKDIRFADRRMARCDGRSSSEETNAPHAMLIRQKGAIQEMMEVKTSSTDASLSESTSQDSLCSESGGGSLTFHRYYHVFKEGELDQLIHEYVENLHIISSYYDHSNWCIIAEKVQVWTI